MKTKPKSKKLKAKLTKLNKAMYCGIQNLAWTNLAIKSLEQELDRMRTLAHKQEQALQTIRTKRVKLV